MIVNAAKLKDLFIGYNAAYQNGFTTAQSDWQNIATQVPSTTGQEHYAWLGQFPKVREWIGDRVINQMRAYDYRISNKQYESSIAIKRTEIADDQYGVYTPLFTAMGQAAKSHPDELLFPMLAAGFNSACYDGQPFFDVDHPVGRENSIISVSNIQAGSGAPWYLMDTRRAIKPVIYQLREPFIFRSVIDLNDSRVFETDEFRFGIDGRANAGYGFWQQAFASQITLNNANFEAAYAAMMAIKSDEGRPMGIRPNLLVTGSSNRAAGLQVLKAERNAAGASNIDFNAVDLLVTPWLD